MYSFIFRRIHFSYEMGKLKLHFSYNSYIKISQTSLIDLFGIWILYVVMGFWLWVWYPKIRTVDIVARKITVEASF